MKIDNIRNLQTSSYRRCLRVTLLLFVIQLFAVSPLQAADNGDKIVIPTLKIKPGTTQKLTIQLKNAEAYTAFQAEFYFPKGITPVMTDGKYSVSLSSRKADHTISSNVVSDGGLKVAAYSMTNESIKGNSGDLFYIDIISESTFEGPETIEVKGILFTKTSDRKEVVFAEESGIVATLIITAKSYTIKYGDDIPTFEYTSEGATVEGIPSTTCEATKTSPVGTYPIVISKGSVTNNNVAYVNGTLTIEKAPLKISAKDYTIQQGDALPTFEATYEGFKNNETAAVLTTQPTISTTATSASDPGDYEITVSGAEAQNYDITYGNGKLTIEEADGILGISIEHPADVYDLQGNKVRSKITSLSGLSKGVYIINGKKVLVK